MTQQLIEEAIKKEAGTIPLPPIFPDMPPSQKQEGTPASRAMGSMDLIKAGQKLTIRSERVADGYNEGFNARVEAARNLNKSIQMDAIQRVAEAVGHNIRAAERTDEILKGTAYDVPGRDAFFGGVVGEVNTPKPGEESPFGDAEYGIKARLAPLPTFVNKDVKYEAMPEYKPTKLSESSTVEKKFAPERGSPSPEMTPPMMAEFLAFDAGQDGGQNKQIKAAEYSKNSMNNLNMNTLPTYAGQIAPNNILNVTGKDPAARTSRITTNNVVTENTADAYRKWMGGDFSNLGNLTDAQNNDVIASALLAEYASKNPKFEKNVWKVTSKFTDPQTRAVVRRVKDPYNLVQVNNGLPVLMLQSASTPVVVPETTVKKLYDEWKKVNKNGNMMQFTNAAMAGQLRDKSAPIDSEGYEAGKATNKFYTVKYKQEFEEAMNYLDTKLNEYWKANGYTKDSRFKKDTDQAASLITSDGWRAMAMGNLFNISTRGGFDRSALRETK